MMSLMLPESVRDLLINACCVKCEVLLCSSVKNEMLNVQSVTAETVPPSLLALSLKNRFTIENQWSESTQSCERTIAALQKTLLLDKHKRPVSGLNRQYKVCSMQYSTSAVTVNVRPSIHCYVLLALA